MDTFVSHREVAMNWNVAQAKQHLSEVIREAAREPQLIHNRNRPVAAVIAAEDLAEYRVWKETRALPPTRMLADEFAELRRILVDAGFEDGLEIPPHIDRPNAFVQMLEEEYPEHTK
jgi:prevent-host-death family protein